MRIFIDMDGTIADTFENSTFLEDMKKPGFFESLKPYHNFIDAISMFVNDNKDNKNIEFYVLSSLSGDQRACATEKNNWLDKHFNYECVTRLFVPEGTHKSSFIGSLSEQDILFDDYSTNIIDWSNNNGRAIKVKNNINCLGVKWTGETISQHDSVDTILSNIVDIVEKRAA